MKMSGNTVLVTGGAGGIGLALAESFLARGNQVIICDRKEERLKEVQAKNPAFQIRVCDVSDESDRTSLFRWTTENFGDLNVLVNNAGIQQEIDLKQGVEALTTRQDELKINLEAPIYLSALFIPHLMKKKESAIINVSSGLAVTPIALFPIYCATKAGIRAFTKCLRKQLSGTPIKVFEVLPGVVDTELNMEFRSKTPGDRRGVKADIYAATVMTDLENDRYEVLNPMLANLATTTIGDLDRIFETINNEFMPTPRTT